MSWCWLFHKWSKWSDPVIADGCCVVNQSRRCERCGDVHKKFSGYAHSFGKWEDDGQVVEYITHLPTKTTREDGRIQIQKRICAKCGIVEARREKL